MERLEKINNDFATLFREGQRLLQEGCGDVMNRHREEAFQRFEALGGIPYKTEDYLYADTLPVFDRDYKVVLKNIKQGVELGEIFKCHVPNLDTNLILTINGWFVQENVVPEIPEGVVICSMAEASVKYKELFEKHYNQYTKPADADGLVALNTAFAQDGVFVYVPDRVVMERPLQIVNLMRANADLMSFQRNMVILGRDAKATILVCDHTLSDDSFLSNNTTEVVVGENAAFEYYHVQNQHIEASQINSVFVSQKRNSRYDANVITLYGGFIRNNLFAALTEEGCESNLYGMYLSDKKQQVDNFTFIDHIAPHCTSNQHFKGVLDDAALANFAGRIVVRPDAQKTEAYQANNNLLLTDTAQVNTKPQLVIDADDVKCNHGSSIGKLDETALFYMRQRGIPEAEARILLQHAFINDVLRRVEIDHLRERLSHLVELRFRGELQKCRDCSLCH